VTKTASDKQVTRSGLDELRRLVEAENVAGIASLLETHPSEGVRLLAARALKRFKHPRSVKALTVAATTDPDTHVRERSLRILAYIDGMEAMPVLVDQLERGERGVRRTACSLISDFDPRDTEGPLTEALLDSDWYVRSMAAMGLGKSSDRRIRTALLEPRRRERHPLVWVTLWRATRRLK
jgi:HEAT repeat protein